MDNGGVPLDGIAFPDWTDDKGVAFSTELLEWSGTFLGVRQTYQNVCTAVSMKTKVFFIPS